MRIPNSSAATTLQRARKAVPGPRAPILAGASCASMLPAFSGGVAFAAALAAISLDTSEVQLLPDGEFSAIDGRPGAGKKWKLDRAAAERLIAHHAAMENDLVIDYDHQTLNAPENGQPAPAAGWFKKLEWRDGQGLFATDVRWTERARQMIAAGEYRYLSPFIYYDHSSMVVRALGPAALVNYAAIDGMQEVALSALAQRLNTYSQENLMNPLLKAVLKALGITDDTKPEEAAAAVLTALGIAEDTKPEDAAAAVAALKAKAARAGQLETEVAALKADTAHKPDPAKFAPIDVVNGLRDQVAALSAQMSGRELEEIVASALKDGRILPAMETWARELGKKDIAALKAYVSSAQPIAALAGTQTHGKKPGASQGELSDAQLSVCTALGVKPEDYKKQLEADRATA